MNNPFGPALFIFALFFTAGPVVAEEEFSLPVLGQEVPLSQIEAITRHYDLPELWQQIQADQPSLPFSSDGCSVWPDTWFAGKDLYEGCFVHDLHYWAGVPGDEMARLRADVWLLMWVAENASIELAEAMFNGVRVGGGELIDTPWRWGFGREGKKE